MVTTSQLPVCDVHAHYLPPEAVPLMQQGRAVVRLDTVGETADSITLNGMPVGSTIHQLSDVDGMVAAMSSAGVDHRVLSPPPFTYRYWNDPHEQLSLCRLLNDAHAQLAADHPDRFSALCTVPLQDPDAALTELERAVDQLGLHGVTCGTNVDGRNLSDAAYSRFFAAVAERGLPVLVHPDFVPNPRLDGYYLLNLVGMPTETAITMANMVMSGMFERLPNLRVCFVHGGGSAPYLFGRWNKGWHVRPEARGDTTRPPQEQLDTVFCDSLTHSPEALAYLVQVIGAERVVVGTDAPFDVEDPEPLRRLHAAPGLTDEERETIKRVTPQRWLHGHVPAAVR